MSEKTSETVWNRDKAKLNTEFTPEMCSDKNLIQDAIRDHAFTDDKFDLLEKIVLQCPGLLYTQPPPVGSSNPVMTPEIRQMLRQQEEDAKRRWSAPKPPGTIRSQDALSHPTPEDEPEEKDAKKEPKKGPTNENEPNPQTKQEGFNMMDEKEKAFMATMREFIDEPTPDHAKNVVVQMMTSISRMFYIPDRMAAEIVNQGYLKGKDEVDPDEKGNYAADYELVRSHLQSYIMVLVSLFAAFNWWYLLFYTSHYVDIKQMLTNPLFTPFIWVVGPIMSPLMSINYWLLGKRLDLPFYNSVVKPVMDNKPFWFTLYLLVFTMVYRPISKFYGDSVQKISNNEPNAFYTIVLIAACFNYFYNVVFNKDRMFFAQRVFSSIILTFILFLILFIFLMMFAKFAVVMIIAYFAFYSTAPLLFFSGEPWNILSEIVRMIRDSSDACVDENIEGNIFIEIKNNLYRYSALIFMSLLVLGVIGKTMGDLPKLRSRDVKITCGLIYSIAFIAQIITVIGIISPSAVNAVKNFIFGIYTKKAEATSATDSDTEPAAPPSGFMHSATESAKSGMSFLLQILMLILRVIELLVMVPFILVDQFFGLFYKLIFGTQESGLSKLMRIIYACIHWIFTLGGYLDAKDE